MASWGSTAGLRRVARLGDGWLASAYNTTPEHFARASRVLADELTRRDPDEIRGRVCVGSPARCAELLSAYAEAGCSRVYFWPVMDEVAQLQRLAQDVLPLVAGQSSRG